MTQLSSGISKAAEELRQYRSSNILGKRPDNPASSKKNYMDNSQVKLHSTTGFAARVKFEKAGIR